MKLAPWRSKKPMLKDFFIEHFPCLFLMTKTNFFYKEEQLTNIILEDYGRTPVVATQDKTKKQRTPQKEDYLRKWECEVLLKNNSNSFIKRSLTIIYMNTSLTMFSLALLMIYPL